jgi:hypothetical protein
MSALDNFRRDHGLSLSGCDDPWTGDKRYPEYQAACDFDRRHTIPTGTGKHRKLSLEERKHWATIWGGNILIAGGYCYCDDPKADKHSIGVILRD